MFIKDIVKKVYIKISYMMNCRKIEKTQKRYFEENKKLLENANDMYAIDQLEMYANRYRVIQYYETHDGRKYQPEIDFVRRQFPHWMQCTDELAKFQNDFKKELEKIEYDFEKKMYYAIRNNKKMYFKKSMTKDAVIRYFMITCFEQSEFSAHRYLEGEFTIEENSVVFDIGAAEGIFALDAIDKVKELYLFECDEEWIEALKYTFAGYDNIHIINKYVGNNSDENCIMLDEYLNIVQNKKLFIKMDIEGAEIAALEGAKKLLNQMIDLKLAVCAYHRQDDYENISKMLTGMELSKSKGYLCPMFGKITPPYFRIGVLRAQKRKCDYEKNN